MASVFISYSHQDKTYANKLAKSIETRGVSVWIDDRIDYGTQWSRVIQENLEACKVVVVIMSPRSLDSIWVQNELLYAIDQRKFVFPVLLEGMAWFSVSSLQWADVRGEKLPPETFYKNIVKIVGLTPVKTPQKAQKLQNLYIPQKPQKKEEPARETFVTQKKSVPQTTALGMVTININADSGVGGWRAYDRLLLDGKEIPVEPFDTGLFSGQSQQALKKEIPVGKHHLKVIWGGEHPGEAEATFIVSKDKHTLINVNEEMHFWRSFSEWTIFVSDVPILGQKNWMDTLK